VRCFLQSWTRLNFNAVSLSEQVRLGFSYSDRPQHHSGLFSGLFKKFDKAAGIIQAKVPGLQAFCADIICRFLLQPGFTSRCVVADSSRRPRSCLCCSYFCGSFCRQGTSLQCVRRRVGRQRHGCGCSCQGASCTPTNAAARMRSATTAVTIVPKVLGIDPAKIDWTHPLWPIANKRYAAARPLCPCAYGSDSPTSPAAHSWTVPRQSAFWASRPNSTTRPSAPARFRRCFLLNNKHCEQVRSNTHGQCLSLWCSRVHVTRNLQSAVTNASQVQTHYLSQ
jgi:hypothetical protein